MKKIKHLFTVLLLLFCTVVNAHDFEVGGIFYNITNSINKTVEVTYKGSSYSEYSNEYTGSVVIPESVTYNGNTYSVTSIGYDAFIDCSGLTSVEIPNSVTSIGSCAFNACTGLTSIVIPNSVTSIGYAAFNTCGLTSIVIPNSVTSIGYFAFAGCSGLTSIVIPNSVTSIGSSAFSGTAWYNNQPDGVVYAGKVLYKYKGTMPENTSIIIEEGTLGIADNVFSGCTGLTSVEIPNSLTSIGESAFSGCSGLTSIEIPNSLTSIGMGAFYGCSRLTSVVIGNSVTSIGDYAFNGCTSLKDLRIEDGEGTLSLGYHTKNSSSIGKGLFYDCPLETLYLGRDLSYNASYDSGNSPFYNKTTLVSVTIGNSVTSIGDYAFTWCSKLTSVVIPNSVTSIGDDAFFSTAWYNNQPDGVVYAGKVLYKYKGTMPENTSIIIEEGTLEITGYAFRDCSGLTSVEIPNSVTSIGGCAFWNCTGLTSVEIPNSVTSIGDYAFSGCSKLTSIEIPNSVTSIGMGAFYGCSGLKRIVIPNGVTSIEYSAFYGCSGLTSIVIGNSVTSIGNYAFDGCSGLTSVEIPNSVTSIGMGAFYGCSGLKRIVIPNGVTSIEYSAFYGCSGLTSIVIGNSVTSIGNYAFDGCSGLTSVEIPNSVTSIGSCAFYNCSGLTSIVIPNSVTSIGEEAFYGCKNLKTVINNSNLNFGKGSKSYGYIAYYADIVITPVNGVSPITSLAELSNSSVYYIYQPYHSKGATSWAVAKDGNALKSNKDLNIAIDKNDTCQRFAILSIDGGVTRYLYHIETQMFVNLDGSLSATPVNAISFMNGAYTNIFIAYFDNEHYVNVGDKQEMIIDDWDTPDGGNSCLIIPVGEFDPSNALEMFEGYTTEIDEMQDENEKVVYDLNGRRIVDAEYLERGVYIINGKKVVY